MRLTEKQRLKWEENNADHDLPDRLLTKIAKGELDQCWEWTGSKDGDGYGRIRHNGRPAMVHRLVYELFIRRPSARVVVMHSCNNRGCANPEHLVVGSRRASIAKRHREGRTVLPPPRKKTVPKTVPAGGTEKK